MPGSGELMFTAGALGVLVAMALALARALMGPTTYDRIMAVNMFGTKTVLLIALLGFMAGRPEFLDIALVYALINFIGTIAVLKFRAYGDLGLASHEEEGDI
jgi:multicomponent Na+:H+ antiporter subunit F